MSVPNFTKPFFLKCDALGSGLGAMLTQEGQSIAFTIKQLCDQNFRKSTYEKQMMVILHEVDNLVIVSPQVTFPNQN